MLPKDKHGYLATSLHLCYPSVNYIYRVIWKKNEIPETSDVLYCGGGAGAQRLLFQKQFFFFFFFKSIVALIPLPLCQSTSSSFSWPSPGCMLGAATHSFINTEPGALWELPACPLSALATEMQVWFVCCSSCVSAGHGG